jgi:hypothetical protein
MPATVHPALSRQQLLETCFAEIPQKIGNLQLRKLSAASFTLLGRLESPMMKGGSSIDMDAMFDAVILYIWVHSADLDLVCSIETAADLPAADIKKLGFEIDFGNALGFLEIYKRCSARMAAALAEVEEDETEEPGKPATAPGPAGSPLSSMPSEDAATPPGNDTFSGNSPSNEPFPICTPPTSPTEPAASGLVLPVLKATDSTTLN